ncbi:hypothetical protein ACFL0W_04390 [Nanoarchaeota archaeon]
MQKLKILNTKERKELLKKINNQWDCDFKTDLVFLLSSKEKIYLANRENLDFQQEHQKSLRIDALGLYFAEIKKGFFRLSIEGSQLIGPLAKKNILEVDQETMKHWLRGNDLEDVKGDYSDFVIISSKNKTAGKIDYCGTGKYSENKIINYVPKARRILSKD